MGCEAVALPTLDRRLVVGKGFSGSTRLYLRAELRHVVTENVSDSDVIAILEFCGQASAQATRNEG